MYSIKICNSSANMNQGGYMVVNNLLTEICSKLSCMIEDLNMENLLKI